MDRVTLLLLLAALLVPAIVGLFYMFRYSRVRKLTGWFTFKPVIVTPVFLMIYLAVGSNSPLVYLSLLPGLFFTLLTLFIFRDILKNRQFILLILPLLILDFVRWGSAVLSVAFAEYTSCISLNCPQNTWGPLLFLFTLAFPTIYAVAALVLSVIFPKEMDMIVPTESVSPPM